MFGHRIAPFRVESFIRNSTQSQNANYLVRYECSAELEFQLERFQSFDEVGVTLIYIKPTDAFTRPANCIHSRRLIIRFYQFGPDEHFFGWNLNFPRLKLETRSENINESFLE